MFNEQPFNVLAFNDTQTTSSSAGGGSGSGGSGTSTTGGGTVAGSVSTAVCTTLDTVQLDLAYLLGETSVPTPTPPERTAFIQRALERCYRLYDFDLNKVTVTLPMNSDGSITLQSNTGINPNMDVRVVTPGTGDDFVFTKIDWEDQDDFGTGDYRYWLTGTPGNYTIFTTESASNIPYVTVRYETIAPVINASICSPFPSSMIIAKGALIYYRLAEDPQADVSQLEALFQEEFEELVSTQIRNQANRPAITRHQVHGTYTGDIGAWGVSDNALQ